MQSAVNELTNTEYGAMWSWRYCAFQLHWQECNTNLQTL